MYRRLGKIRQTVLVSILIFMTKYLIETTEKSFILAYGFKEFLGLIAWPLDLVLFGKLL